VSLADAQLSQSRAALGLAQGDPLESLEPENAPPVREAKALWDEAKARIARVRQLQLHSRNTVTQEEYDQALAAEGAAAARHAAAINAVKEKIAQIKVRESELAVARQHLANTVIYAPFDGLVQERHVGHGAFVQVGNAIATLVRTSTLRFHGTVPERHAHRLALGQQAKLTIEGVPQPREAKVTRISPTVEGMSRSLAFEAVVDNRDGVLRTGLFAEAEVIVDPSAMAIVLPKAALLEFAGAEKVWKIVDGVARELIVQTGRRGEFGVEVVKNLAPGDVILAKAVEGRVTRVEPLQSLITPVRSEATEPAEGVSEEENVPTVDISAPASLSHNHPVSR